MEPQDYLLHSVKNAMKILRLFTLDRPEWGISEISRLLNLSKSTVHRLVVTLSREGYLEKTPKGEKYQLGFSLLGLSGVMAANTEIYREAVPILEKLVDQLGEAAHISILEGNEIVYLHKVECKHPVRLLSHIGKRNPAYCTSSGKVLLAYLNEQAMNAVLASEELIPYSPRTITDKHALQLNLLKIKKQGYDIAVDELHEGVVSLAVPVRDFTHQVVAAISVIGPTQRIREDQYLPYVWIA